MHFQKTILTNGLRVITVPLKDNPTVTVLVMVEAGSQYETKDISGISHFLEHMCFKGTLRRPTSFDIARELDTLGASYNAFTGPEFTGYYAKVQAKDFPAALDIVSDLYLNPSRRASMSRIYSRRSCTATSQQDGISQARASRYPVSRKRIS